MQVAELADGGRWIISVGQLEQEFKWEEMLMITSGAVNTSSASSEGREENSQPSGGQRAVNIWQVLEGVPKREKNIYSGRWVAGILVSWHRWSSCIPQGAGQFGRGLPNEKRHLRALRLFGILWFILLFIW
jgi:hypothetical protein